MKQVILLISAFFIALVFLGNLDGALPENTNAPGDLTCGRAPCHNIPVNVGDSQISITFNNGDTTYLADSIYPVTVKIQNQMTLRNGFQILALNASNQNTGTWVLTAPDKMKIIPGISFPNRKYVTHRAAGNQQNEWTMNWKAPAATVSQVTFYASVLSANNNGQNTGDEVYSTILVATKSAVSATGGLTEDDFKVYPIPATSGVWIEVPESFGSCRVALFNGGFLKVKETRLNGKGPQFFETENLPAGVYFIQIISEKSRIVKKTVIQ